MDVQGDFYRHSGDVAAAVEVSRCVDDARKDIVTVNSLMTALIDHVHCTRAL